MKRKYLEIELIGDVERRMHQPFNLNCVPEDIREYNYVRILSLTSVFLLGIHSVYIKYYKLIYFFLQD